MSARVDDDLAVWSLYFIRCSAGPVKVGRAKNVAKRLSDLQVANPYELTLIDGFECGLVRTVAEIESFVHRKLSAFHIRGEWFTTEAEPFIARLIELVRTRHRRSSIGTEIREGNWHQGLAEAPLPSLSERGRKGSLVSIEARRHRRALPRKRRAPGRWLWRGQWRG